MSRVLLHEISEIQMGYSFRSGLEPSQTGSTGVIQMKDLADDRVVHLNSVVRISTEVSPQQRVHIGDIVLRSRGDRATSAIVADDPGVAIVAAPLLRIRITDRRVLPPYLNWFINQPPAQAHFAKHAEGSNVKMISKAALETLEVEVPPIDRQLRMAELADLSARRRILSLAIESLSSKLVSDTMMDYAKGSEGR